MEAIMEKEYLISQKELKKFKEQSEKIYHMSFVLSYFCEHQQEIEELRNLTPGLKYLVHASDNLYSDLFELLLGD